MKEVQRAIRSAKIRLWVDRFTRSLVEGLLIVWLFLLVPAIYLKLTDWDGKVFHLLWFSLLAVVWAAVSLLRSEINDTVASLEVDERFGLRERISSAWSLRGDHDPMVGLLHHDATAHAKSLEIGQRFPLALPPKTFFLSVPLLIFVAVAFWLPPLPGSVEGEAQAKTEDKPLDKKKIEAIAKLLKPKVEKPKPKKDEVKPATGEMRFENPLSKLAKKIQREKMTKKQALSALSNERKKLQAKKDRLAKLRQAQSRLKKQPGKPKFTKEVREGLSSGDPAKAAAALSALAKKVEKGSLSSQDKAQLGKELESLARALEGNPKLQSELKKAVASLKSSAGEGTEGLSTANLKELKKSLANAAGNLDDLKRLMEQSGNIETLMSNLDAAKYAMTNGVGQCKACGGIKSGSGCSSCGSGMGLAGMGSGSGAGSGMGGPGRGRGNQANRYREPEVTLTDENVKTGWKAGRPLGVFEVEATDSPAFSTLGESVAFVEAGGSEETVVREEIPPGYEDMIQGYFDRDE